MSLRKHHTCIIESFYLKKAVVSVINDLVTDQRVHKACLALQKAGFEVLLVGRKLPNSPPLGQRPYACHRMRLPFTKGPLFYAAFNIRLFFILLFKKHNLLLANDLDTLLANFLVSRIKKSRLLFDSHEYFTETPELTDRKLVQKIWKFIEAWIVPKLPEMITVNESIAALFRKKYAVQVHVVRNIPPRYIQPIPFSRKEAGLPGDKKILLLQGSGINVQRGAEELVEAMQWLPNFVLLIIGGGDVISVLHKIVTDKQLNDRVVFFPRMTYTDMMRFTALADLGLTLDKDTNINYRFSLPNKLFDYMHAGVPVLASPLPEIKKIIDAYQTGTFIVSHEPKAIASSILDVFSDTERLKMWRENCLKAAQELNWEREEEKLLNIYDRYR